MSERSPQCHHALRHKRTRKRWRDANLWEAVCHRLAAVEARKAFPLPDEQQAESDARLGEKYPARKREGPRGGHPTTFDDLPRAK